MAAGENVRHLSTYVIFVCALVKWMTSKQYLLLVRSSYVLGVAAALLALLQFVAGRSAGFRLSRRSGSRASRTESGLT